MKTKPNRGRGGYERGFIPARLVVDLIDNWLEDKERKDFPNPTGMLIIRLFPEETHGLSVWEAGKSKHERSIRRLRDQKWIGFSRADHIVTALGGWTYNNELWEAYMRVNLASLDISRPTCSAVQLQNAHRLRTRLEELGSMKALGEELKLRYSTLRGAMELAQA